MNTIAYRTHAISESYQKTENALFVSESSGHLGDKVHLVFRIVRAGYQDVLQCSFGIDTKPLGNSLDSFVAECALGINIRSLWVDGT